MRIALLGGTGKEGKGLALRWALVGHEIAIGSRDAERGRAGAALLTEHLRQGHSAEAGKVSISGGDNLWAASAADIAVLCVPYAAHGDTLRTLGSALGGKILMDLTVPLVPPKVQRVHLPPGRAAALEAQELLGSSVRVVAALHHVSSAHLVSPGHPIDCDVLVCADDADASAQAIALIGQLGVRALDAGPLENAIALEAFTPVLLHLNRRYKSRGSGLRITGIPEGGSGGEARKKPEGHG